MTRFGKTLFATAFVAGLGALGMAQPASAAPTTLDMVFNMPAGTSASGSITFDPVQIGANGACALGAGCGFTGFAATFDMGEPSFTFAPENAISILLTLSGGIPTGFFAQLDTVASNEDPNDFAQLFISDAGFALTGVIDGFEFNLRNSFAIIVPGPGEEPDPVGVPEPATLALFGAGLVGATLMRRKRNVAA